MEQVRHSNKIRPFGWGTTVDVAADSFSYLHRAILGDESTERWYSFLGAVAAYGYRFTSLRSRVRHPI